MYDSFLKKQEQYADYKAKVFTVIMGQCSKAMHNKVEMAGNYESAEKNSDVVAVLHIIKDVSFSSDELKYPSMQAAHALRALLVGRQQGSEDLMDYYKWYVSLIEMVERSYGQIIPEEIAKKHEDYTTDEDKAWKEECGKLLAFLFMDGADKKVYGFLMRTLVQEYALGNGMYPVMMEDALQVLALNTPRDVSDNKQGKDSGDGIGESSFMQSSKVRGCWICGSMKHYKKDCPNHGNASQGSESSNDNGTSNMQVSSLGTELQCKIRWWE